jgi:divinyl protochlorophyllide a 8-vinyl-reductase
MSGARIGPNAVTRLAEAAEAAMGRGETRALFAAAGLERHLDAPPGRMVAEGEVVALHAALAARWPGAARRIAADAGARTAAYLLANRIPRLAQVVLRVLPPGLAARGLMAAIGGHAWTFAGSGAFAARVRRGGAEVTVTGGPFAAPGAAAVPMAAFYGAVFETLFRRLVSARTGAQARAADGACAVRLGWRPLPSRPFPSTAQTG